MVEENGSSDVLSQIPKDFIMERQGKKMVLYAGLVHVATVEFGLIKLTATLIQFPTKENDMTAICASEAIFEKDGKIRTFQCIGDASPSTCSKNVAPHFIRMSATRAKGRVLRDGTDIGVVTAEELDDVDIDSGEGMADGRGRGNSNGRSTGRRPAGKPLSEAQLQLIYSLGHDRGYTDAELEQKVVENCGCPVDQLPSQDASALINQLKAAVEAAAKVQAAPAEPTAAPATEVSTEGSIAANAAPASAPGAAAPARSDGGAGERKIPATWVQGLRDLEQQAGKTPDQHAKNYRKQQGYPEVLKDFTMAQAKTYRAELELLLAKPKGSNGVETPVRAG